ncbi:MAG: methyltransferase domain-containing protein, partial [Desulfobulbaceae bacterium]|nr:methyltransferase domain-containing protein [Desulfobulbaceae bacterium]
MSLRTVKNCIVCNGSNIAPFFKIPNYPIILRPISKEMHDHLDGQKMPRTMPLEVGMCQDCTHLMLTKRLSDDLEKLLYTSLYSTYISMLEMGIGAAGVDNFLKLFSNHLVSKIPQGASILEIGCYDGYILQQLGEQGFHAEGCDPSDGASIGIKKGLNIKKSFFCKGLYPTDNFDVVFNRHVIEHIEALPEFLANITDVAKKTSYLCFETPNANFYLSKGLLDPFHPEHLSVFTTVSLRKCLESHGISVTEMFSETKDLITICKQEENIPTHRFGDEKDHLLALASEFTQRHEENINKLRSIIEKVNSENASLALWGAGSSSLRFLTMAEGIGLKTNKLLIVDKDTRKQGQRFFIDSDIPPIASPDVLKGQSVDY